MVDELDEIHKRMKSNDEYIGIRYVMALAVKALGQDEKDFEQKNGREMSDAERRDALVKNVDEALVRHDHHLTETERATIAVKWDKAILDPNHDISKFVDDKAIKEISAKEIVTLPAGVDYPVYFDGLRINQMSFGDKIALAQNVEVKTGISANELMEIGNRGLEFEKAAKRAGLVDYPNKTLSDKLNGIEVTPEEIEQKKAQLKALESKPEVQQQIKQQKQEDQEKAEIREQQRENGPSGGLGQLLSMFGGGGGLGEGGMGGILMLLVAAFTGMFSGGKNKDNDREASPDQAAGLKQWSKDHGSVSLKGVMGFDVDKDHNNKIDADELKAADKKLAELVETNPDIKKAADEFKSLLHKAHDTGKNLEDTQKMLAAKQEAGNSVQR